MTGCTKVSPGCAHCYAETFAERWRGVPGHPYEQGFDLRLWPERLEQPLRWRRPRMIFVNSMSDLFHEDIPADYIAEVFDVMGARSWHTFQVLTKRHERLAELAPELDWPPNVWMGVTIENRRFVHRADYLRQVPAAVRFISRRAAARPAGGARPRPASTGSSPAARAARGTGPCERSGCATCATAAGPRASRSSSSSGAACARSPAEGSCKGARGTRCQRTAQRPR